jgi:hypothetical protein
MNDRSSFKRKSAAKVGRAIAFLLRASGIDHTIFFHNQLCLLKIYCLKFSIPPAILCLQSGATTKYGGCGNREPGVNPGLSRSGIGEQTLHVRMHRHCLKMSGKP